MFIELRVIVADRNDRDGTIGTVLLSCEAPAGGMIA